VSLDVGESGGFALEVGGVQNRVGHWKCSYGPNTTSWGRYVKCNAALHLAVEQTKNVGPQAHPAAGDVDNADRAWIVLAGGRPGTRVDQRVANGACH
jgi:hypothetical protein